MQVRRLVCIVASLFCWIGDSKPLLYGLRAADANWKAGLVGAVNRAIVSIAQETIGDNRSTLPENDWGQSFYTCQKTIGDNRSTL